MIRAHESRDLDAVVALFQRSVREVARRDYSAAELAAWAPECPDLQAWRRGLSGRNLVATRPAGLPVRLEALLSTFAEDTESQQFAGP